MRVTNSMLVRTFNRNLGNNLNALGDLQTKLAKNKNYAHMSDDPIAVIFAQQARNNLTRIADYQRNVASLRDWNRQTEDALYDLNKIIADALSATIDAAMDSKTAEDKSLIAETVKELRDHLLQVLNTTFNSKYVFGAYNTAGYPSMPPFEVIDNNLSFNRVDLTDRVYTLTAGSGLVYPEGDIFFDGYEHDADGNKIEPPTHAAAKIAVIDPKVFQSGSMGASSLNVKFADGGNGSLAVTVGTQTVTVTKADLDAGKLKLTFDKMGLTVEFKDTALKDVLESMHIGQTFTAVGGAIEGAVVSVGDPAFENIKNALGKNAYAVTDISAPHEIEYTDIFGQLQKAQGIAITMGTGKTYEFTVADLRSGAVNFPDLGIQIDFCGTRNADGTVDVAATGTFGMWLNETVGGTVFDSYGDTINAAPVTVSDPAIVTAMIASNNPTDLTLTYLAWDATSDEVGLTLGGNTFWFARSVIMGGPVSLDNGTANYGIEVDFSQSTGNFSNWVTAAVAAGVTYGEHITNPNGIIIGNTVGTATPPPYAGDNRVSIWSEEIKVLPTNLWIGVSSTPSEEAVAAGHDRILGDKPGFDVAPGVSPIETAKNGIDAVMFGDGRDVNYNIYNLLDDLYNAMKRGEDGSVLTNYITGLQDAQTHVLSQMAEIGGRQTRLDMLEARYALDEVNYTQMLSDAEDADQAELIMREQMAQAVYKASLQTGAYIIQPTLMDFLR